MNGKLKIALIVGVILIVGGVGACMAGYAAGGMKDVGFSTSGWPRVIDRSDGKQWVKVDETFDSASAIKIDVAAMSKVVVKEGPTLSVKGQSYSAIGEFTAVRAADGTVSVTQGRKAKGWWFGLNFRGLFKDRDVLDDSYVEVTVPRGTTLSAVSLDVDSGTVEMENVAADKITVDSDFGDVAAKKLSGDAILVQSSSGDIAAEGLTCDSLKIDSDYGKTEVRDVNAKDVSLDSSSGRIAIEDLSASGGLTVNSDYGDVALSAVNAGSADVNLSSGNFSADGVSLANGLKLDSNYGSIALSGLLRGASAIESDLGDIDPKLDGAENDYFVTADVDAGDVAIDGRKAGNVFDGRFENGPQEAPNKVAINSNFGDVKVEFRG
jgi:hypothetical protein